MRSIGICLLLLLSLAPTAVGRAQTPAPEETGRLAALGQVWGFLKYYHPGVATGTLDWDSVLLAAVPRVRGTASAASYLAVLHSLLDVAGPVSACAVCRHDDADALVMNLDLRWLDSPRFDDSLRVRLAYVRDNRHTGSGRYVQFPPPNTARFEADTAYHASQQPGEGVRLLALFRYWNAIHYYFPYKYVNDGDWNDVLTEFVPLMIAASDVAAYHLTVLELTTRVRDTHVVTRSELLDQVLGSRPPVFEARSVDGRILVWKAGRHGPARDSGIAAGDVITHVDGVPVAELRERLARYVAAGNEAAFERNLVRLMLRARSDSATYTLERRGRVLARRLPTAEPPPDPFSPRTLPTYPVTDLVQVLPGDIGYVNMGDIERSQVDSAVSILRGTRGIVMDVRNYPRGTFAMFAAFFNPAATPFARFTIPDSTYPGRFRGIGPIPVGATNPDHYRGRVAILVDERTQSHGEFTAMALQTAPEHRVIGSQTAGADGNVAAFLLPGGIRTFFTALGVYYPDGRQTQRIGIVPDIEARATAAGVREGRDEVLERALAYIRSGS